LIDLISTSPLTLGLGAKCHPGIYGKEIKLWTPQCYRVYEVVASPENILFLRNKAKGWRKRAKK
jgi:hypothetical protein